MGWLSWFDSSCCIFVFILSCCVQTESSPVEVDMLAFYGSSGLSESRKIQFQIASSMVFENFNSNSSLTEIRQYKYYAAKSLQNFSERMIESASPLIVGALTSDETVELYIFSQIWSSVLVGGSSSAPSLSDKLVYPKLARTVPAMNLNIEFVIDFIIRMGWKRVSIMNSDLLFAIDSRIIFVNKLTKLGIEVAAFAEFASPLRRFSNTLEQDLDLNLDVLEEANSNIIIYLGSHLAFTAILKRAFARDMIGKSANGQFFVWISVSIDCQALLSHEYEETPYCDHFCFDQLKHKVPGILCVKYDDELNPEWEADWNNTTNSNALTQVQKDLSGLDHFKRPNMDVWAKYYSDASMLFLLAIDAMCELNRTCYETVASQSDRLIESMKSLTFDGATFNVSIDDNLDRVIGISLSQVINEELDAVDIRDTTLLTNANEYIWPGYGIGIPTDVKTHVTHQWYDYLLRVVFVIGLALIIAAVVGLVHIMRHIKKQGLTITSQLVSIVLVMVLSTLSLSWVLFICAITIDPPNWVDRLPFPIFFPNHLPILILMSWTCLRAIDTHLATKHAVQMKVFRRNTISRVGLGIVCAILLIIVIVLWNWISFELSSLDWRHAGAIIEVHTIGSNVSFSMQRIFYECFESKYKALACEFTLFPGLVVVIITAIVTSLASADVKKYSNVCTLSSATDRFAEWYQISIALSIMLSSHISYWVLLIVYNPDELRIGQSRGTLTITILEIWRSILLIMHLIVFMMEMILVIYFTMIRLNSRIAILARQQMRNNDLHIKEDISNPFDPVRALRINHMRNQSIKYALTQDIAIKNIAIEELKGRLEILEVILKRQ
eukprot:TRINITY_DN3600_c1_g1_i7.p1 TRINITY_DN3600_c1_g1~~TRINITY_DN3600_c1_g1_i7.p1  ORF type:complete len:837 (-),score=108.83 TRINITY_DN3600_c1_g1_i7:10-2520(-)